MRPKKKKGQETWMLHNKGREKATSLTRRNSTQRQGTGTCDKASDKNNRGFPSLTLGEGRKTGKFPGGGGGGIPRKTTPSCVGRYKGRATENSEGNLVCCLGGGGDGTRRNKLA